MKQLTEFEKYVIEQKGTEQPFSGEYLKHDAPGVYLCKKCLAPLYKSEHKFNAHCGWPAFDDEIPGAIDRTPDEDGHRIEITCRKCDGHLGHIFEGEMLTAKNIRHCVNSVSMIFQTADELQKVNSNQFATFGAGCFWCIEAVFNELKGVIEVTPGYSGGSGSDANYMAVCSGDTGHAEVILVEFDPSIISYQSLLAVFFAIHNPTTLNQQGNDKGPQYRSVIFTHSTEQVDQATIAISKLIQQAIWPKPIVTEVAMFEAFYPAESVHENYYANNAEQPYCELIIKPKFEMAMKRFEQLLKDTDK
ncbi:peptide-methionine (S)-S-oxide reductase [Shewanella sp. 10N.286.52.C2]|uniref:bifunctional methionine sulfoxide reductase B/A protein n=1 Tax=Shewanella sp. 10N.286.52.C2 TaxID=1880838 RepID=UPI000C86801B|nr:bifunctional methionine sulfoxide reductase B/A protein [Shewanella sp. 10N.286.52.C2]PMG29246.1 peptide-methionine (S)-S-oxide reductase [Shewanella sp. 10N.286.52.C2]